MKECLKELLEKYVFVPEDKAANNIIVVCKHYYLEVIYKELGLWPGTTSSDTYIPETMDPKEISGKHISYMKSLGFIEDNLSDKFPNFYWTPKLHKTSYKLRFIASSFNCTAKPLFVLLTRVLSAIKGKLSNMSYLLTNWLEYLYGRIQSPRPDVMPDRREGITRAAGFVFACIDTQAS